MIRDNLARIQDDIASICQKCGRDPQEITLIGITKYADVAQILEAIAGGLGNVGENKVQEAKRKFPALKNTQHPIIHHMVGHLQTNKVKDALKVFDIVQSLDSLRLAQEVEKQASKLQRVIDCLIQVNTSGEDQKFGISSEETVSLIEKLLDLKHIKVLGLMTIGPLDGDEERTRKCFKQLKQLSEKIKTLFTEVPWMEMKYLSMGMTNDYSIALEEGSNMVRIGRAIFADN